MCTKENQKVKRPIGNLVAEQLIGLPGGCELAPLPQRGTVAAGRLRAHLLHSACTAESGSAPAGHSWGQTSLTASKMVTPPMCKWKLRGGNKKNRENN